MERGEKTKKKKKRKRNWRISRPKCRRTGFLEINSSSIFRLQIFLVIARTYKSVEITKMFGSTKKPVSCDREREKEREKERNK